MNMAEQLRLIGGFGPEALRDIEHDLACAIVVAPFNRRGGINWTRAFPWLRARLSELQGHQCCWCGCSMVEDGPKPQRPTFDHIEPLARGGKDTPDNLAIACFQCNFGRGSQRPFFRLRMPWHSDLLLEETACLCGLS
jgi:5-methylcytosine-specific restriction endonuclease McrA